MPAARTAKTSAELILTVLQGQSRLGRNCLTTTISHLLFSKRGWNDNAFNRGIQYEAEHVG